MSVDPTEVAYELTKVLGRNWQQRLLDLEAALARLRESIAETNATDIDGPGPCPHGLVTGCACGWPRSTWLGTFHGAPVFTSDAVPDSAVAFVDSEAHAPDPVDDTTTELDDVVWVRSTGRGTHDVMMAANPVPIVLASIMFTEGVKGRTLALERFAAALGSVSQDVHP